MRVQPATARRKPHDGFPLKFFSAEIRQRKTSLAPALGSSKQILERTKDMRAEKRGQGA